MKYNLLKIILFQAFLMTGPLLVSSTVLAAPKCGLSMNAPNINLVWNQNFSYQQITFTVNKSKKDSCNFTVAFGYGGATSFGARRMLKGSTQLNYQLFKDASLTQVLKDARDATSHSDVPVETDSVNITTQIPKIIDLSIGVPGNAFDPTQTTRTLEFGTLAQGQSQSLDLLLRTNAGYSVSFSSQNNGVLKHSSSEVVTEIPYVVSVNASIRNMSNSKTSPVVVATGAGQTSISGVSNTVQFTIGDTQQKMSGRYTDFITVTAATTE